jgi:ribosomal protein L35
MPKMKTHKATSKRYKLTKNKKIIKRTVEKRFKKEEMLHIKKYCLIASARKKILK